MTVTFVENTAPINIESDLNSDGADVQTATILDSSRVIDALSASIRPVGMTKISVRDVVVSSSHWPRDSCRIGLKSGKRMRVSIAAANQDNAKNSSRLW